MSDVFAGFPNFRIAQSNAKCTGASAERCPYQLYRTSSDITYEWKSVMSNLRSALRFLRPSAGAGLAPLSRPALWGYPDMLVVGFLASAAEDRSHFGAWAILSSPLTLSFDLTNATTLERVWPIIANRHILQVNAAWDGEPGRVVRSDPEHLVSAKSLERNNS